MFFNRLEKVTIGFDIDRDESWQHKQEFKANLLRGSALAFSFNIAYSFARFCSPIACGRAQGPGTPRLEPRTLFVMTSANLLS